MNRLLLESTLNQMKTYLAEGKGLGNLKIVALLALGNQLEALFYFVGHELGSKLELHEEGELDQVLARVCDRFSLGQFQIIERSQEHISFSLVNSESIRDLANITTPTTEKFCSFEAGLFAGVVEKITGKHCFAQELHCRMQGAHDHCEFMIVIPN
jgi:predicted hydrocarbon binding protein